MTALGIELITGIEMRATYVYATKTAVMLSLAGKFFTPYAPVRREGNLGPVLRDFSDRLHIVNKLEANNVCAMMIYPLPSVHKASVAVSRIMFYNYPWR